MRNRLSCKTCRRHALITAFGIIAFAHVLLGGIAGATPYEYIFNNNSDNIPGIYLETNTVEAVENIGSTSPDPGQFTVPPSPGLPVAYFITNVTGGYTPLPVQFNDSSESATEWNWVFGDGTSSTKRNPTHTYSRAGTYTVNLTAGNGNGTNSYLATILANSVFPEASFICSVTTGYIPFSVQFTDLSKNETSRSWNFGDGAISTQQNPAHTYSRAGTYTVNLTAKNGNGTNSYITTILAKSILPAASFTCNVTNGYTPLSVQFTDTSKNATSRNWEFGDGAVSSQQNLTHIYSKAGNYIVNLTASNGNGTSSYSNTIKAKSIFPAASFTCNVTNGYTPLSVLFTDTSQYEASRNWEFGDGAVSTLQNLTYTYSRAGTYTVNLTAKNGNGTRSYLTTILVNPVTTIASFTCNVTSGYAPLSVQFTDTSQNETSRNWDFGD